MAVGEARGVFVLHLVPLAWSMLCSTSPRPCPDFSRHLLPPYPSPCRHLSSCRKVCPCTFIIPYQCLVKRGELGGVKSSVSMQCCFYLEHHQVVCSWLCVMQAASKVSASPQRGRQASLADHVFLKRTQLSGAHWGKIFHSDPSIILTEQLLTLVNSNQVFSFFFLLLLFFCIHVKLLQVNTEWN